MQHSTESIKARPMQSDDDFWRLRQLLIETYPTTPLGFNWEIRRWEGQRFYDREPSWQSRMAGRVQLWERANGQLVGAINPEGMGNAHLQVHPHFRQIEAEMIAWAEDHLALPTDDGRRQLEIFVYDYNTTRKHLLVGLGYMETASPGVARRLHFSDHTLEAPVLADGYTLRTTQPTDQSDCQQIADLLNAAFQRDFHTALEYQNFTKLAPSFRADLDLVAVAPNGDFAAYVGIPYDEVNRHATFEPVCTHPDHRRHGVARTLMLEGLQRLKGLRAIDVTVETGAMIPANQLYDSLGFTETFKGSTWQKIG